VAQLLHPQTVTVLDAGERPPGDGYDYWSHASLSTALALSDLSWLYKLPPGVRENKKEYSLSHKIAFYIAHVFATPVGFLRSLSRDLEAQARIGSSSG
jgi:hypothetical protein